MADYESLFPGRFLKSADFLGKDVTLTIAGVKAEDIDDKTKAVLSFEGTKKQMVLNRTNAESLVLMFGRETNAWIGRVVVFYPATMKDPFGDGEITAIRVRGSPEITEAKSKTIQRGRKTIKVSVTPTGKSAAAKPNQGNGKPPANPGPVEKIAALLEAAGIEKGARAELVKQATNKTARKDFNDDDVALVQQLVADLKAQSAPPAPPPEQQEEDAF